jgi:predicted RND superfamily exporter protein
MLKKTTQPTTDGESPLFRRWGRIVLRYHVVIAVLTTLVTVWMTWATWDRLRVDNSIELFIPEGAESVTVLEEMRDAFGQNELFLVAASGDVFTEEFLTRLGALHDALSSLSPPLESLGERLSDRQVRRGAGADLVEAPRAGPAESEEDSDEDFGDFDSFEDDGQETWEGLGGGTAVDEVISLVSARRTWMVGDTLNVGDWMTPRPTAETMAEWRKAVLAERSLVPQLVDPTGRHATLGIRTQFMADEDSDRFHRATLEVLDAHARPGFELTLGGAPAIDATFNWMMMRDMAVLLLSATLVMLAILSWLFRHLVGIAAPIIVVNLAVAWTVGFMAVAGMPVGLLSSMLPAFIFVVGVGDSIHLLSVFRTEHMKGVTAEEAILRAMARTGMPILYTTLTTTVGLLSFEFASVLAIRQLGTAGAVGVIMAMVSTLTVLPVLLYWTRKSRFAKEAFVNEAPERVDRIDQVLRWCFALSAPPAGNTRRVHGPMLRVLGAGALLTAIACALIPSINVAHDPMAWFDDDVPVKQAAMLLDEHHGGSSSLQVFLKAPGERGFKDLRVLEALESFEDYIEAYRDPDGSSLTGPVSSILNVVRETHRAMNGGGEAELRLPSTQRGSTDMLFLFENAGPAQLSRLATIDLRTTVMSIQVRWREASSYAPLLAYVQEGIARFFTPLGVETLEAKITGGVPLFHSVVTSLIRDLLRSFSVALVVITLLMILFLGGLSLGLLAMAPNLIPILFVIGFMSAFNIPVDLNNLLIGSIVIGIAVDDTIHLLHHIRIHLSRGESIEVALDHARKDAGKAVVSTSLILFFGYMTFIAGSVAPIIRFGLLCGLAISMALLVDLILLPALLRLVYGQRKPA